MSRTKSGELWLRRFKKGGLLTLYLVIHFLYHRDWTDSIADDPGEELIHNLSKVKVSVFEELFNT